MSCACKSGNRTLAIVSENLFVAFPEVVEYAESAGWEIARELDAVAAAIGPAHRLKSRSELENLFRAMVGPERLAKLRIAPLRPDVPLVEQQSDIRRAEPLIGDRIESSSPILEILETRRIESFVQPIVRVNGSVWGFECLMRATDAEGGRISPVQLINWAKRENLVFMLDRVCRELHIERASRLLAGRDLKALINFLPTAIYEPSFCLMSTLAAAKRSALDVRKVIFEVVETEKITDFAHLSRILEQYRRMGFGVALDDMGSGYSGLELLASLQPDLIKIDREIVRQAPTSPWHATICRMLTTIAHEHGRLALAEGVETEAERDLALDCGVDLLQGFLIARPTAADELGRIEDALLEPVCG